MSSKKKNDAEKNSKAKKLEEKNLEEENFAEDEFVIEMEDEDGNVFRYVEELVIPVNGERFAFLVEIDPEHEHECDCDDDECDCEDAVIIAKIVENEDGEEEYIEPTEEEFEAVQAAYEELLSDEEE